MRNKSLTRKQEAEIFPLIDKATSLAIGKAIIYNCTPARADYLARMITGVRYSDAIESILIYPADDPLYGQGLYPTLWVEPHPQGLVLAQLPSPRETLPWRLIQVAAHHEPITLEHVYGTANARLQRFFKRYPDVFDHVWIDAGPPVTARYGQCDPEELAVVDVDYHPSIPKMPEPHPEDYAKSGMKNFPPDA